MEKKRKKSINTNECNIEEKVKRIDTEFSYNQLPTEIILKIFGYLSLKDLCRTARFDFRYKLATFFSNCFFKSVCKSWRRIAHDETLWYHIDLSKLEVIDLKRLWKLIRQPYASRAKSIEIHTPPQKSKLKL